MLSGRVVDATDAGIPGATVTVKTLETGAARSATTDESGPGSCRHSGGTAGSARRKDGFKAAVRLGINLAVAQEAVADLKLEVGAVAEASP